MMAERGASNYEVNGILLVEIDVFHLEGARPDMFHR